MARRILTAREQVDLLSPWITAVQLDSINPTGGVFVDYRPQDRTGPHGPQVTTLDKIHGNDDPITIYRGAPRDQAQINPGDFVTDNEQGARDYAGNGHVLRMQVPKSHVATDPDEWDGGEHIYSPPEHRTSSSWLATARQELPYLRNNNGMRDRVTPEEFGQQTEPWGRYMSPEFLGTDGENHGRLQPGWERGTVGFDNPLYVPHEYGAWKQNLSQAHGGLTGKALSQALLDKGHDGVITHDQYGLGEMVDLRPKGQRGHQRSAAPIWQKIPSDLSWGEDLDPDLGNDKPLTHRQRQPSDEPTGKWYHVSTQPLAPGTKVVPRGGPSPDSDFYDDEGTGYDNTNRQNHVWLAPSLARAHSWSSDLNARYIHEVKPGDKPQPWNLSGTNGWVAPHAHVIRQVPPEEAKQADADYWNSTRYHPGGHTEILPGAKWAARTAAADDRHPDHGWQERLFGCAHTACGRVLPSYRTAAAFDDPSGWRNSSAVAPSPIATQGAAAYNSAVGLPQPPATDFSKPFRSSQSVATVGRAYDALPTYSPDAVPHYAAMQKEINDQYDHMTNRLGINVQSVDHDPYPDVHHMMADVNNNRRLQVLGTHVTGGHPFFSDEDNDKFRAVHDFFGHAGTGRGFDRHGEEAAFVKHGQMFTPSARNALASETRGQNSSLILNGGFPTQKIATMDSRMHTARAEDWSHNADTGWYTHPNGHVIKPSDEQPGTYQLWAPTVSMKPGGGGLAKDLQPHPDLVKHMDWAEKTGGADHFPSVEHVTPEHLDHIFNDTNLLAAGNRHYNRGAAEYHAMDFDRKADHFDNHVVPLYQEHGLPIPGKPPYLNFQDALLDSWRGLEKRSARSRTMGRRILTAREQVEMLEPWTVEAKWPSGDKQQAEAPDFGTALTNQFTFEPHPSGGYQVRHPPNETQRRNKQPGRLMADPNGRRWNPQPGHIFPDLDSAVDGAMNWGGPHGISRQYDENPMKFAGSWYVQAVDTHGMGDHAYHTEEHHPYGHEPSEEDERRTQGVQADDESGYNWGPEPRLAGVGDEVFRHLKENPGGVTFKHHPGDGPSSGYMVSKPGAEKKQDYATMTPGDVDNYYGDHPEIADPDTDDNYGGWEQDREPHEGHGSDWYHDVSNNIEDSYDAARAGVDGKQIAIFDNDKVDHEGKPLDDAYVNTTNLVNSGPASALGWTHARRHR